MEPVHLKMPLSYTEFFECYMKTNRPVIIGADLVSSWPAFVLWRTSREKDTCLPGKEINWDYLADRYGHHEVTVADCATSDSFGNLECTSSPFIDIVNKWKCGEGRSLYVKDWHLALTETSEAIEGSKKSQAFYITPDLFRDDWMNSYYTAHTADDFRFVYVGAAGTFTPLHRDVYCSYSWSTNVCGRKRWWLFPPEQTPYLFLKGRNVSVHDVRDVDLTRFPEYAKTTPIVVDQEEGETIFVPSGWYHQVENLTACISINHNWCNSVNLPSLYLSMCDKVVEVEEALEDVREMLITSQDNKEEETDWKREFVKIVQDVVKQDAGWNWLIFWKMVLHALRAASNADTQSVLGEQNIKIGSQPIFKPAPVHLRPSLSFIESRVAFCYGDFIKRDRLENEGEVAEVVVQVQKMMIIS